jgi:hypothetical protein
MLPRKQIIDGQDKNVRKKTSRVQEAIAKSKTQIDEWHPRGKNLNSALKNQKLAKKLFKKRSEKNIAFSQCSH